MQTPDYRDFQHSNELYHYGMPRRSGRYPWGSGRNPYQSAVKKALKGKERSEYFRSERTIPKGTIMFRTTTSKDSDLNKGSSTYVTYLDPDRDLYKGGYIRSRDRKQAYEHEMVLEKDLKIPSRETFKKTIDDVVNENPKLLKESVESFLDIMVPKGTFGRWQIETDPDTGKHDTRFWDEYVEDSYSFRKDIPIDEQWGSIAVSLGKADKLKDAIIDDLKKKGYNAMVDEAGVGGAGTHMAEGVDPLIIFDSSVLANVKSSKISIDDEKISAKNYTKWQNKIKTADRKNKW